jgi:hypothetical protein
VIQQDQKDQMGSVGEGWFVGEGSLTNRAAKRVRDPSSKRLEVDFRDEREGLK